MDSASRWACRGHDVDEIESIETDYLVIGAGAMAMAFIDVVLKQDRKPVGGRRSARSAGRPLERRVSFVTLHQPAAFYGVVLDAPGHRRDRPRVAARDRRLLRRRDAAVRGNGPCALPSDEQLTKAMASVTSILNPDRQTQLSARRRIVDATYHESRFPRW